MRRAVALLALALLALACGPPAVDTSPLYAVRDGQLVDAAGQTLRLRAINLRGEAKTHPDHLLPLQDAELALLLDSGFNSVRLLTFWGAVMPERGRLDRDYLQRLRAEVQRLTAAGLLVVVDLHQDLWGEPFGDGAPAWACPDDFTAGYQATSPWWLNYLSPQVSGCFDLLWTDAALRAELTRGWTALAATVCSEAGVVGFDLLNEPWPGSSLGVLHFDQAVLYRRFYRPLMDAIDAVCPGRLFFLEPSRAYDLGLADRLVLDDRDRARAVLAPHFYPAEVHEAARGYDGDAARLQGMFDHLFAPYLDKGVALWLGEWGGLVDGPGFGAYVDDMTRLLLERGLGSALWVYGCGNEGFAFANAAGKRQAPFDRAAGLPVPTRLPSSPGAISVQLEPPDMSVQVHCQPGRGVEWQLPAGRAWQLEVLPAGGLGPIALHGHVLRAACAGDGALALQVRAAD